MVIGKPASQMRQSMQMKHAGVSSFDALQCTLQQLQHGPLKAIGVAKVAATAAQVWIGQQQWSRKEGIPSCMSCLRVAF